MAKLVRMVRMVKLGWSLPKLSSLSLSISQVPEGYLLVPECYLSVPDGYLLVISTSCRCRAARAGKNSTTVLVKLYLVDSKTSLRANKVQPAA